MRLKHFAIVPLGVLALVSVTSADLVARWTLNQTPGSTTAVDSVAGVNGSLQGSAAFVTGGINGGDALSLDGTTGSYVTMGNNFGFGSGSFSVVAWIKSTQTSGPAVPVSKQNEFSLNGYTLSMNSGFGYGAPNKIQFYDGGQPLQTAVSSATVNDNAWHQIVGTYQAGGNISLYVDGTFQKSLAAVSIIGNTAPFMLGGVYNPNTQQPEGDYAGLIDDVQLYNSVLTQSQVTQLYVNAGTAVPEPRSVGLLLAAGTLVVASARRRVNRRGI